MLTIAFLTRTKEKFYCIFQNIIEQTFSVSGMLSLVRLKDWSLF